MAASGAEWISVPDAPVYRGPVNNGSRAADGTSWFAPGRFTNSGVSPVKGVWIDKLELSCVR